MPRTDSPADLCRIVLLVFLLALYVSACGEDTHTDPERRDVTPPGSVTNLFAQRVAGDSVLLRWSAPGDDEHEGRASHYQIRYHEDYITEASWESATPVSNVPTPSESGVVERVRIGNLESKLWHFALRAADEEMNWSALSNVANARLDTISPAAITDLEVLSFDASSVTLTWTATGDDGNEGRAQFYDIRHSSHAIDGEFEFFEATLVYGAPTPADPGVRETYEIGGLVPETPYYFAILVVDDARNASTLSNVVLVGTDQDTIPPAPVIDLALEFVGGRSASFRWTAPGNNGDQGQATEYDLRFSLDPITIENWDSATRCTDLQAPAEPGIEERFTATGLDPDQTYHFALRTLDRRGNVSELSNGVSATTQSLTLFPHPVPLTNPQTPDWEPGGARIALSIERIGDTQIYLMSAQGGDPVKITDYDRLASLPRWSPNGDVLAVVTLGAVYPPRGPSVALVEPESGFDPIPISTHVFGWTIRGLSWSPDGTRIAYILMSGDRLPSSKILTVDVSGLPPDTLFSDDSRVTGLDWSPDGQQIVFSCDMAGTYDLWLLPIEGGKPTQITEDPSKETQPRWSPDGDAIVFVSDRAGNSDLWKVAPSGGTWTQITSGPFDATYPAWSPDGRDIAFIHSEGTLRLAIQCLP
jgi:WD40 repeat protein